MKVLLALLVVAGLANAVAAVGNRGSSASALHIPAASRAACTSSSIGFIGPITGPAASIGQEQLHWAQFEVEKFNEEDGTSFKLVQGNSQLNPALARTLAARFASNGSILGVVGPAASREVDAIGPLLEQAGMAFVSASATRISLTIPGTHPTFFRVVPHEGRQGVTDANFMNRVLRAQSVTIIDDRGSYGTGLADQVQAIFEKRGTDVKRESVGRKVTDFSSLVSTIGPSTDVVFLPWQRAASAQLFGEEMKRQGKKAIIFGSDRLFSPKDFTIEGAYVSAFAPDITGLEADAEIVSAYTRQYGRFGTFGPPTALAAEVLMTAMKAACADGRADRGEVLKNVSGVTIADSILGGTFRFSKLTHDPLGARFSIFQVRDGKYTLVK